MPDEVSVALKRVHLSNHRILLGMSLARLMFLLPSLLAPNAQEANPMIKSVSYPPWHFSPLLANGSKHG